MGRRVRSFQHFMSIRKESFEIEVRRRDAAQEPDVSRWVQGRFRERLIVRRLESIG